MVIRAAGYDLVGIYRDYSPPDRRAEKRVDEIATTDSTVGGIDWGLNQSKAAVGRLFALGLDFEIS